MEAPKGYEYHSPPGVTEPQLRWKGPGPDPASLPPVAPEVAAAENKAAAKAAKKLAGKKPVPKKVAVKK